MASRGAAPAPAQAHDVSERRVQRLRVQLHGGGFAPRERHRDALGVERNAGQARVGRVANRAPREPARANATELEATHAATEGQRQNVALFDVARAGGRAERPPVLRAQTLDEPSPGAALGGGGAPVENELLRLVHDHTKPLDGFRVGHFKRVVPQRVERRGARGGYARDTRVIRDRFAIFGTSIQTRVPASPGEVLVRDDQHVPRADPAAQGRPVRERVRVEALEAGAFFFVVRRAFFSGWDAIQKVVRPRVRAATLERRRERAQRSQPLVDDVPRTRHEGRPGRISGNIGNIGTSFFVFGFASFLSEDGSFRRVSARALQERGGDDRLTRAHRVRDQTAARERRRKLFCFEKAFFRVRLGRDSRRESRLDRARGSEAPGAAGRKASPRLRKLHARIPDFSPVPRGLAPPTPFPCRSVGPTGPSQGQPVVVYTYVHTYMDAHT